MYRSISASRFALLLSLSMFFVPCLAVRGDDASAAIYKAKCASCHGADGAGSTPAGKALKVRDLSSDAAQKLTDVELTKIIADGKGKMPAYAKKLTADQIKSLVVAIRDMAAK